MFVCVARGGAARRLAIAAPDARSRRQILWPRLLNALAYLSVTLSIGLFSALGKGEEPPSKASTAWTTRDEASRSLPLKRLTAEAREKVTGVINESSLFRRLPVETVDCDPDLFQFFLLNPDLMVNIWQVMGVTNITLERIDADHYRCADGDGTTAKVEVVYRSRDMQIVYAEGMYEGPLFPRPVKGQCVCVLKHMNMRDNKGRYRETARLDTFLRVENIGVELLAKIFQGLVGRTIDHNFSETIAFVGSVSRIAEMNPRGMHRLAARLEHVEPERREQFAQVTDRVAEKLSGLNIDDQEESGALADAMRAAGGKVSR